MDMRSPTPRLVLFSLLVFVGLSVSLGAGCSDDSDAQADGDAQIAITYPQPGAFVGKSRVMVRGTASGVDKLEVNEQHADVVGGEWKVLVDFDEGDARATASGGGAKAQVDFVVDTTAPLIELDQPARGLVVEKVDGDEEASAEVVFAGRALEEASGLKVLSLDGAGVSFDDDGRFTHTAELRPGYNEFELKAVDEAGNTTNTLRAVLYGPLAGGTDEIESAADVQLAPELFEDASEVLLALLTPEKVTEFAQNSMGELANFELDAIDFQDLEIDIAPHSKDQSYDTGYITLNLSVDALEIAGTVTIEEEAFAVKITLDHIEEVSTKVFLKASDEGGLDISFEESQLELEKDDLHFEIDGVEDTDSSFDDVLRTVATRVAKSAFSHILSDELFDEFYDPGLLRRSVDLLGRTLEFQLYIRQVNIDAIRGIFVNASLAVDSPKYEDVPEVPGALNLAQGGSGEGTTLSGDLLFSTRRTAANRLLHGAWRSGLLNQELVGSDFAGFELPVELSAAELSLVLDSRIAGLADSSTPAGLKLRPQLPPVVALKKSAAAEDEDANDIRIQMGELLVDLQLLPEGGAPIDIVTVALFLDVTAQFTTREGKLALSLDASARADVDAKPTVDLDDTKVEDLLSNLVAIATQMLGDEMQLGAETEFGWLTITEPEAEVHGAEFDRLSVAADVEAVVPEE